jgi:hypothetical protein
MTQQILSLCIPRLESKITKEFIINTFNNLNVGKIEKIKELPLRNDKTHKRIIMTLILNSSENSIFIKDRIEKNETIKVVYDMPWYWKIQGTRS